MMFKNHRALIEILEWHGMAWHARETGDVMMYQWSTHH